MIKFLDLKKQYLSIKQEIDEAIFEVIDKTAFIGGESIAEFEKSFADYLGVSEVIGVASGTDALEIAIWSLNLPRNSEVLVPANSFIATSEAISRNSLKVKFVDCDEFYQIDIDSLKNSISKNSSAIIAVHLYGHPANMASIQKIAKENNLKVIEDCAQAHSSGIDKIKVGNFSDVSAFSFYPGKNLGAFGDGGAVVTNNKELAIKIRKYANHGSIKKYSHEFEGRNSRLDSIQASVLNVKLKYLDFWTNKRNKIANYYLSNIKNPKIKLPKVRKNITHSWHLFVIQVKEREKFINYMRQNEIQVAIHYPTALPKLEAYSYLNFDCGNFKSCKEDKFLVSIPIGEHLSNEDISLIIQAINYW